MSNDVGASRTVSCPACGSKASVPASIIQVRCASCGNVFTPTTPVASSAVATNSAASSSTNSNHIMLGAAVVLGGILLVSFVGAAMMLFTFQDSPEKSDPVESVVERELADTEPTVFPDPSEVVYREIRLPEATRQAIYKDYRAAARTTIEKPLPLPSGSPARVPLETMLQQTLDRELSRFAALHNVSVEDIGEVINEGDAKRWDPSPRSNATRNGIRLYPKSMSEGWTKSANVR